MKNIVSWIVLSMLSWSTLFSNDSTVTQKNIIAGMSTGNSEIGDIAFGFRAVNGLFCEAHYGVSRANTETGTAFYFFDDYASIGLSYRFSPIHAMTPTVSASYGKVFLQTAGDTRNSMLLRNNIGSILCGMEYRVFNSVIDEMRLSFHIGARTSDIQDQGKIRSAAVRLGFLIYQ